MSRHTKPGELKGKSLDSELARKDLFYLYCWLSDNLSVDQLGTLSFYIESSDYSRSSRSRQMHYKTGRWQNS